jgi:NAD-dependent deacetylase
VRQDLVYPLKHWEIKKGDKFVKWDLKLSPHIVWFGEAVPEMDKAAELAEKADIFITIGTSLNVYPAANLIHVIEGHIPKFLVDPGDFNLDYIKNLTIIKATAVEGMKVLSKKLNELI